MEGRDYKLLDLLAAERQLRMPLFQRRYAWGLEERKKLVRDVQNIGLAREDQPEHFFGSIIHVDAGSVTLGSLQLFNVIDGQQRLVTISLLLAAIANRPNADEVEVSLRKQYLINENRTHDQRHRLKLNSLDAGIYEAIVDNQVSAIVPNQSSLIYDNYRYFSSKLQDAALLQAIKIGLPRLKVISTLLKPPGDNVHSTFESINSTGKPLTKFDLIRNYILMNLPLVEQDKLYSSSWSLIENLFETYKNDRRGDVDSFVREYLGIKTGQKPLERDIYEDFKSYHKSGVASQQDLAKDLLTWARLHAYVAFGGPFPLDDSEKTLQNQLSDLRIVGGDQFYGLAMQILKQIEEQDSSLDEGRAILLLFESFIVRRYLRGLPTNARNKIVVKLLSFVKNHGSLTKINVANTLKSANMVPIQRTPDDKEIESSLATQPLYGVKGTVLTAILLKLGNSGNREQVLSKHYSIEHVMPRTLDSVWRSDLGVDAESIHAIYVDALPNLTLVAYNAELGNRQFTSKRDLEKIGYSQSAFPLNSWIANQEAWDAKVIEERARVLSKRIASVWPYPVDGITETVLKERNEFVGHLPANSRSQALALIESFEESAYLNVEYAEALQIKADNVKIVSLAPTGTLTLYFSSMTDVEALADLSARQLLQDNVRSLIGLEVTDSLPDQSEKFEIKIRGLTSRTSSAIAKAIALSLKTTSIATESNSVGDDLFLASSADNL